MSRIGKVPVQIPTGVEVKITDQNVSVKGPNGELNKEFSKNKEKLSCKEKISLLNRNIIEFHELANEIYDEAILMGVRKEQIEEVLSTTVKNINSTLKIV